MLEILSVIIQFLFPEFRAGYLTAGPSVTVLAKCTLSIKVNLINVTHKLTF